MSKILTFLLDIIFPKFCLNCNIEGTWLCLNCWRNIKTKTHQGCPVCRKISHGNVCHSCLNLTPLNGLIVGSEYDNDLIKKLIHYYKYQNIKMLHKPLGSLLIKTINTLNDKTFNKVLNTTGKTIIISIPLHKKRLLERGYNQSSLLANYIAKKLNLTYDNQLVLRRKNTNIQAKLSKKERLINLSSAFKLNNKFDFHDKNVIIVDDVATTLATLNSCAKVLRKAGVNQIWGLVLARGEFK